MQSLLNRPCKSLAFFAASSSSFGSSDAVQDSKLIKASTFRVNGNPGPNSFRNLAFCCNFPVPGATHIGFCSQNDVFDVENGGIREEEELELLSKPNLVPKTSGFPSEDGNASGKADRDEVLEPFLKFFKPEEEEGELGNSKERSQAEKNYNSDIKKEEREKVRIEYYDPKLGDLVVAVVVSGNENKLDVNIGADLLGTMLTKEILPLYDKEMDYLLCDMKYDAEQYMVNGKMGIVKDDDVANEEVRQRAGRPVVEVGTVIFAEVLGRTLSGRPLLSARRYFRRIAWHRVRQIKQLNEPIEVKITEWNTGGLLTRIEGLRAFIPKQELVKRVNSFTELKENVGRRLFVQITRINEDTNDLILSERTAWEKLYLREGTLLEGTVVKIFPYGAQIKIGESNRSGLLHISNITRKRIGSVSDVLQVDEKVKVLIVKSLFPDRISLSIADLESEPGLFISNRERVFAEAEAMAKKYRQKLPPVPASNKLEPPPTSSLPLDKEEDLYANWDWFKFKSGNESVH